MTEITNTKSSRFARLNAVVCGTAVGIAGALASIYAFELYGIGLFVVLPVVIGFVAAAVASAPGPIGFGRAALVGVASVLGVSALFLVFGLEGIICLIMAAPLWIPGAVFGACVGAVAMRWIHDGKAQRTMLALVIATLPVSLGAEWAVQSDPELFKVTSTVHIAAPPQSVWHHVVTFDELPEPTEWMFTHGVAYPTHARIEGRGVGAVRHCVFSTGAFVEPITRWDEPTLLAFDVVESPPPMTEWSFHEHVHAPHLHGFFDSRRGQFKLIEQPDGSTRLEGTTWYIHRIAPQWYWRLWSDPIIHAIHDRVLNHIKQSAEAAP